MTINEMNNTNTGADSMPCKMPFDMTVEEWERHLLRSADEHKQLYDSMTEKQLFEYAARFNQRLIDEVIKDWDCAKIERIIHIHPDLTFQFPTGVTPEEYRTQKIRKNAELAASNTEYHAALPHKTKRQKARAAAYKMLLTELLPGSIHFMLQTFHYGIKDREFIMSEAMSLAEDEANRFVYEWEQYDDYDYTATSAKQ